MDVAHSRRLIDGIEALGDSLEKLDRDLTSALSPESLIALRGAVTELTATCNEIQRYANYERDFGAIAAFAASTSNIQICEEFAAFVVSQLVALTGAQSAAFVMRDSVANENIFVQVRGISPFSMGERIAGGKGLIGRVIATGKPYFTNSGNGTQDNCHAAMALPLTTEGQTHGLLWLTRQSEFNQNEIRLLRAIGDITAINLHRHLTVIALAQRSNELAAAQNALKALDELKTKFINDMSHELRTPVTGLNMILYLLERNGQEKYAQYLNNMREDVERLTTLSESILDITRLEAKLNSAQFEPIDFNALLIQLADIYQTRAQTLGISWNFTATDAPLMTIGDQSLLLKAIGNLLTNAMSYSLKGAVSVRTSRDETEKSAILSIENNGMGIDLQDLPHIFDRFYRGHHVAESNIPGAGLGLAVVKEIVKLHQGHIEVESIASDKTRFTMSLPLKRQEQ